MKNIEVEIKSLLTKEKFEDLLVFFKSHAEFLGDDYQETIYFDCPQDFRLQRNNSYSKLCYKSGKVHDEQREEIEIKFAKEDFANFLKLIKNLNFNEEIKWLRNRNSFNWDGITVTLDHTKGYGYIIELERMSNQTEKDKILSELNNRLKGLGIIKTDISVFDEKFNNYKNNWQQLLKDVNKAA